MTAIEQKTILKEWEIKTIDDVSLVFKGKGLSKDKIDPSGKNKCILYGQLFTTYNEIIKEVKSKTDFDEGVRSQCGDILMPGSTTTKAEDLAIASVILEDNILLGGDINILRKKDNIYNSAFLAYYLTHYKKKEIGSFGQGITIIHLYGRDIKKVKLILPPLSEQKKIAKILSTVDCEINKTDEIILKTEKLKDGLMQKLFTKGIGHKRFKKTKIGNVPEEWEVVELANVSKIIDCLHQTPKFSSEGFPMVRVTDIKTGILQLDKALRVDEEVFKKFIGNYKPKKGDIVLSRVGSYGVSSYVNSDELFCIGQNTVVVNSSINSKYLFYVLNSKQIKQQIENECMGSGYKSISLKSIKAFKIPFSPEDEQNKIAEILSSVDEKININKEFKEKLIQLKKGLMQDLLSGGVRVK